MPMGVEGVEGSGGGWGVPRLQDKGVNMGLEKARESVKKKNNKKGKINKRSITTMGGINRACTSGSP